MWNLEESGEFIVSMRILLLFEDIQVGWCLKVLSENTAAWIIRDLDKADSRNRKDVRDETYEEKWKPAEKIA